MKLRIFTKKWYEARQLALSTNDTSFDRCISQVINFAMPAPWLIKELEKRYGIISDKRYRIDNIIYAFRNRGVDQDWIQRAYTLKYKIDAEYLDVMNKLHEESMGGEKIISIYADKGMEHSFYWEICYPDKKWTRFMNGGIIFHDNHWQIHT